MTSKNLGKWFTPKGDTSLSVSGYSLFSVNNKVYIVSGRIKTMKEIVDYPAIMSCEVDKDGSMVEWVHECYLPALTTDCVVYVTDKRVYLFGNKERLAFFSTEPNLSTVTNALSAPILDNGSLGEWVYGVEPPSDKKTPKVVVIKNKIYMFYNAKHLTNKNTSPIYVADLNETGEQVSDWVLHSLLPEDSYDASVTLVGKRLFLTGHTVGTKFHGRHQAPSSYCTVGEDGSLGEWIKDIDPPANSSYRAVFHHDGKLYIWCDEEEETMEVLYSRSVDKNGLKGWVKVARTEKSIIGASTCVANGYLMVAGHERQPAFRSLKDRLISLKLSASKAVVKTPTRVRDSSIKFPTTRLVDSLLKLKKVNHFVLTAFRTNESLYKLAEAILSANPWLESDDLMWREASNLRPYFATLTVINVADLTGIDLSKYRVAIKEGSTIITVRP